MELIRRNFKLKRVINLNEIIDGSTVFYMEQEDIDADAIIHDESIERDEKMLVFQNTDDINEEERYCYIKTKTHITEDGYTKKICVKKIIVERNLISKDLFFRFFTILLQQEENYRLDRICVPNIIDMCFYGNIKEVADKISRYLFALYSNFTSDICPNYQIK